MCEPGRLWSDLYFEWINHAAVILIMLSENYFDSPACRNEFEDAVQKQVPDVNDSERVVRGRSGYPTRARLIGRKVPALDPYHDSG